MHTFHHITYLSNYVINLNNLIHHMYTHMWYYKLPWIESKLYHSNFTWYQRVKIRRYIERLEWVVAFEVRCIWMRFDRNILREVNNSNYRCNLCLSIFSLFFLDVIMAFLFSGKPHSSHEHYRQEDLLIVYYWILILGLVGHKYKLLYFV